MTKAAGITYLSADLTNPELNVDKDYYGMFDRICCQSAESANC